jgi:hypothetical protein
MRFQLLTAVFLFLGVGNAIEPGSMFQLVIPYTPG